MADSRAVVGGLNIGQGKQVSTEGSSAGSMFRPSSSILPKGGRTNPGIEEKDLEASENKWPSAPSPTPESGRNRSPCNHFV